MINLEVKKAFSRAVWRLTVNVPYCFRDVSNENHLDEPQDTDSKGQL